MKTPCYAVDAISFRMIFLIADFIRNKKVDKDCTGHSQRQPCNIDKGCQLIPKDGAKRHLKIVTDHKVKILFEQGLLRKDHAVGKRLLSRHIEGKKIF